MPLGDAGATTLKESAIVPLVVLSVKPVMLLEAVFDT